MSFSSLPTELVRQIIESSIPSTFHSTTYTERQSTIRSFCLVSRLFLQIAQSLLFEIIWIASQDRMDCVLALAHEEGHSLCTQQLVLGRGFNARVLEASFQQLIGSESSLGKLVLASRGLDAFPSMRLPRSAQSNGSPESTSFALVDAEGEYAEYLLETEISALFPQLDVLSIDLNVWTSLNADFRRNISTKTLIDCIPVSMERTLDNSTQALNIRIYMDPDDVLSADDLEEISESLTSCATMLKEAAPPIPAIFFLPLSLQLCHKLPPILASAAQAFLKASEQKHIEIVWEVSPADFEVDPVISPEFWRRQRERRRLERDQAT